MAGEPSLDLIIVPLPKEGSRGRVTAKFLEATREKGEKWYIKRFCIKKRSDLDFMKGEGHEARWYGTSFLSVILKDV